MKALGTVEDRENIFFSAILKIGCLLYKNIFFQKNWEQNIMLFFILLLFFENIYLNFVVLPHGVRGYLTDFVRPPWGWSTGFIATPLTRGLFPKVLQYPALPLKHLEFSKIETLSNIAIE